MGRSPKAWGLGQNLKICFPPARGAYFSIKCSQNAGLEGFATKGSGSWSQGPGLRFLSVFAIFLNFNFISIFIGLRPHFGRFSVSKPRFWPPETHPKSIQNAFKIDVPKNMQFSMHFCYFFIFFVSSISWKYVFYLGKINILKVFAKSMLLQCSCIFPPKNRPKTLPKWGPSA